MRNHYVYKYVYDGRIVYIGKVDSDLQRRIDEHALEDRFQEFPGAEIYCMRLNNAAETTCMEMLLINKYKPVLNIRDKYPETLSIRFEEPDWVPAGDVLIQAAPPAEEGNRSALLQEINFWQRVAESGKAGSFVINADEIRNINPRGFSLHGSYYQVFTLRYDIAHLATFVFSSNGYGNICRYLGEYIDILKGKEAGKDA